MPLKSGIHLRRWKYRNGKKIITHILGVKETVRSGEKARHICIGKRKYDVFDHVFLFSFLLFLLFFCSIKIIGHFGLLFQQDEYRRTNNKCAKTKKKDIQV